MSNNFLKRELRKNEKLKEKVQEMGKKKKKKKGIWNKVTYDLYNGNKQASFIFSNKILLFYYFYYLAKETFETELREKKKKLKKKCRMDKSNTKNLGSSSSCRL